MRTMRILGLAVLTIFAMAPALFASDVRLEAELVGPAIHDMEPEGDADFRMVGDRLRLSVDVEDVNFPDGTKLMVKIEGHPVGIIALDDGMGELDLDTDDGDMVPHVEVGDYIAVFYGMQKVLSGVFMEKD